MKINLNNPNEFNLEAVSQLIATEDDSVNTQFRVTEDGMLHLSRDYGNKNLEGIIFRIETNIAGNGYVGKFHCSSLSIDCSISPITLEWITVEATQI